MGVCTKQLYATDIYMPDYDTEKAGNAIYKAICENELSWITIPDLSKKPDHVNLLEFILPYVQWEGTFTNGNLVDLEFIGDKEGSIFTILKAMAPYMVDGGQIVFHNEKNQLYGYFFLNGELFRKDAFSTKQPVIAIDYESWIDSLTDEALNQLLMTAQAHNKFVRDVLRIFEMTTLSRKQKLKLLFYNDKENISIDIYRSYVEHIDKNGYIPFSAWLNI